MSKSLRLSEKWFRRGLWVVAVIFAGFLIALGSTIVGDLPRVEHRLELDDFIDHAAAEPLRNTIHEADRIEQQAAREREQADLKLLTAQQASRAARETFTNWIATRHATAQPDQDTELITRTKALDALKLKEDEAQRAVGAQRQVALDARQSRQGAQQQLALLEEDARKKLDAEYRRIELRVFGYRLALTLPLLVIAGWLFVKKRKSTWWPFVWGFIYFALFAFFVELVPYLPSYGGYVHSVVGIVMTVLVGRYAIIALNRYLARQKLAEAQPDTVRRNELSYDTALARLAKSVCPGCERPVDLKNTEIDFCPHCGIGLFDHCRVCKTRKSAFAKFCHACGTGAVAPPPDLPLQVQPASTT
ncbi:serine endopeptidase [Variovorax sp. GT1P44]|uniref:serine endopeptidase n=1 Tax=Variovorax sp. GT1P44 TaxID=3443742 RepID=UPI003F451392